MKAVTVIRQTKQSTIGEIYSLYDLKCDAYYKYVTRFTLEKVKENQVIELVKLRRKTLSKTGCLKLLFYFQDEFKKADLKIGRDKLFHILRRNDLLVKPKRASCRTTNSYHHFHKYNNLIKDFTPAGINQVWITDITYIRIVNGFCYLALVTDLFSRKIVGYDTSDSLELLGALRALNMAIRNADNLKRLIHHSNRGVQYCSYAYTGELLKRGIGISMTEDNHCYENAVAKRINGILKDEFYLDQTFYSTKYAKMAVKNAIKLYNNERLYVSLEYKTPNSVYQNNEIININL